MAWVLDSTSTEAVVTVSALEGNAQVGTISVPSSASPGQTIVVSVPVTNSGGQGADTLMVRLYTIDPDTGGNVLPSSDNTVGIVNIGQTVDASFNVTIPANWAKTSINFRAEGYHEEGF